VKPEHGGTIELKLERSSDEEVAYGATLATPDGSWGARVSVAIADGRVELEVDDGAPGWLVDLARNVMRSVWRARASAGWPRRITRWRAGPEAR
jgi:hypothetical protein